MPVVAMALMKEACREKQAYPGCQTIGNPENFRAPLKVVWGASSSPVMEYRKNECKQPPANIEEQLSDLGSLLYKGFLGKNTEQTTLCSYTKYIYIDELLALARSSNAEERQFAKDLVSDRIVLYGTSFKGLKDLAISPVHGAVPGVFMHAMALDNLLTDGNRYRVAASTQIINFAFWFIWVVIVALWAHKKKDNIPSMHGVVLLILFQVLIIIVNRYWLNFSVGNWISMIFMGGLILQMVSARCDRTCYFSCPR